MANIYGRQVVLPLTNKSGGGVIAGDVVVIDTSNDGSFTTTTTAQWQQSVGIAQETIANNATGRVLTFGYAALVNVPSSMTRGRYLETHTVAKQATQNTTRRAGSFGQYLTGGSTPTAWLWGFPDNAGASGETVATSAIWTAKGQIAAATGSGAASALTVGTNGYILTADSAQSTGLKYVPGPNLWTMSKSSSQTLTASTDTTITFDVTAVDGGGSVIDLANDRFVVPSTGFYMAFATWIWETTAPGASAALALYVNGSDNKASRCRIPVAGSADGGFNANWGVSLTSGDLLLLKINPGGGGVTPTARGNAALQISSSFTLLRVI